MRNCTLDQDEGGTKFRVLGEGEKLNQMLVKQHFVLIDLWKQAVQFIVYEAKKLEHGGSVTGCLIGKWGGGREASVSLT